MSRERVLIVDDIEAMREQYAYDLTRIGGYETLTAGGGREALEALEHDIVDCVVLDLEMPGMDGFSVLRTLREHGNTVPVVVYTGTGDFDRCVRAVKLGAFGFIDKGESVERLTQEIASALDRSRLRRRVAALEAHLDNETPLLGESHVMKKLRDEVAKLAQIPSPVLIVGESGSGKELVAHELHRAGPRAGKDWVVLNCAALPETLVESELFGHERGAFTGADRTRRGAFESAHQGTLFLDEIGELPKETQAKLLRVLETGTVQRVGATGEVAIDVRVVAATHRDLERLVEDGHFRKDLLYRLNVHVLHVPPLRERLSDVPLLAARLTDVICQRFGIPPRPFTEDALETLSQCEWRQNNVRELRNALEKTVFNAWEAEEIDLEHLPEGVKSAHGRRHGAVSGGSSRIGRAGFAGGASATYVARAEAGRREGNRLGRPRAQRLAHLEHRERTRPGGSLQPSQDHAPARNQAVTATRHDQPS